MAARSAQLISTGKRRKVIKIGAVPDSMDEALDSMDEALDSIDEALIREGLGHAWTRDGQHRDYLIELETIARRQGAGCLW